MNVYLNQKTPVNVQRKRKIYGLGVVEECPKCFGKCYDDGGSPCQRCNGEGVVKALEDFRNIN